MFNRLSIAYECLNFDFTLFGTSKIMNKKPQLYTVAKRSMLKSSLSSLFLPICLTLNLHLADSGTYRLSIIRKNIIKINAWDLVLVLITRHSKKFEIIHPIQTPSSHILSGNTGWERTGINCSLIIRLFLEFIFILVNYLVHFLYIFIRLLFGDLFTPKFIN